MKITRYIYAYKALDDFILLYPLYALFFAASGLGPFAISTLFVIWSVVSIVAEVPSGVLADRYSRRKLLIVGQIIRALGYACWLVWSQYWGYAAGFTLWAIGGAFASGTFEALVYDELKKQKQEGMYAKVTGRAASMALAGQLAATALAAGALVWGHPAIIGLSIGAVLLSALAISLVPEAPPIEAVEDDEGYWQSLRRGVQEAMHNPHILKIILFGSVVGAVYGSLEEYDSLFLNAIGASDQVVALVLAGIGVVAVVASLVAYRFEHLSRRVFLALFGLSGLCLVGAGALKGVPGVVLLAAYTFLLKGVGVIYDAKLQHSITSNLRATITSVGGFLMEVISVGFYLIFGWLAGLGGYAGGYASVGLGVLFIAFLFLAVGKRMFRVPAITKA